MPVLVDEDIVVVNSADIVAYLDYRYPTKCVYPNDPAARVHARAWERIADTFVDPILVDISYWKWAERPDKMPDGLLEAARADLHIVYDALNKELAERQFVADLYQSLTSRCFHMWRVREQWRLNSRREITPMLAVGSRKCGACRFARLT